MGGYTTGPKSLIDLLRQRSRPYLFSNSLAPSIVGSSIKVRKPCFLIFSVILVRFVNQQWANITQTC